MLNKNLLLISLLVVGVVLTSCGKKKSAPAPVVSFNITSAEALGGRDINPARYASGARAAADNSNGSALVKIMQDGTLESAFSANVSEIDGLPVDDAQEMTHYSKLTDIFLPPKNSGCSDVFLLFDGETHFPSEYQDNPGNVGFWSLSQLLCIHSDNTWTDILYDDPMGLDLYFISSKKNIQIADDGSLFLLFRDGGGWEYYIRKYDAKTKQVTEVCRFGQSAPLVEETVGWTKDDWDKNFINIDRFEISKDGKWAYIEIRKRDKEYIHVVQVDKPANYTDIILDSINDTNYGMNIPCWDYDEKTNQLYYLKVDRDASRNITANTVYFVNSEGKNPDVFKSLSVNEYINGLLVVAKDTVWTFDEQSEEVILKKITKATEATEEQVTIDLPSWDVTNAYFYCENNYIMKDNAVYFCYGAEYLYDDYNGYYKYNKIFGVSVTDHLTNANIIDYSEQLSEKFNIIVTGWNVGDKKLYISGVRNDNYKPVNYAINLDGTGTPEKLAEGQVFTCIGSLK